MTAPSAFEPIDRVSFFDEQRRNRRATWRLRFTSWIALAVMGIPVSLVLTPLIYAVFLIFLHLVQIIHPFSPEFWKSLENLVLLIPHTVEAVAEPSPIGLQIGKILLGAGALLLPGILFMFFLWFILRIALHRNGVAGMLQSLKAREFRRDVLEEKQLANLVEEMAIAAGVAPPQFRILEGNYANGAVLGTSERESSLLLSDGLLLSLNREQTQAAVAHLVASLGNGDLRISMLTVSVFETYGLLLMLFGAPFGAKSRQALKSLLSLIFRRGDAEQQAVESRLLSQMLTEGIHADSDLEKVMNVNSSTPWYRRAMIFPLLPLILSNLTIRITLFFSIAFLLGPVFSLLWRSRRYLADADAVRLTRNPDALAAALTRMEAGTKDLPKSVWSSHLFMSGAKSTSFAEASGLGMMFSFNPPLKRRLKRLQKMGAVLQLPNALPPKHRMWWLSITLVVILVPLFALLIYLAVMLIAMLAMLNLMIMSVALAIIHALFSLLH